MKWLAQNWIWLVVIALFVVVMLLGQAGRGGPRRSRLRDDDEKRDVSPRAERPFGRTGHPH